MDSEKREKNQRFLEKMRLEREKQEKKKKSIRNTIIALVFITAIFLGYKNQIFSLENFANSVSKGMTSRVKIMIALGLANDDDKNWGLVDTVKNNNLEMAKILIEKGANVNFAPKQGLNLLSLSIVMKSNDVGNYLIEKGADTKVMIEENGLKWSLLDICVSVGNLEMLKRLLNKSEINNVNSAKQTLLYEAITAEKPNLELIKYLVDNGADVNVKNKAGMSIILMMVLENKLDIVKILAESGQNIKGKDTRGLTLIDYPVTEEMKKYLLSIGFRKNFEFEGLGD